MLHKKGLSTLTKFVREEPALWIGHPLKRKEDRRLLTGLGQFVDDIKLPGMAYAAILRRPYAHARILGIDVSKAERRERVVGTLVGEEAAQLTDPYRQVC